MNAISNYDFTISESLISIEDLKTFLKDYCKKWCFQLEQGEETGYKHYQGRISLKVKERKTGVIKKFVKGAHISITSTENIDNDFYVTKSDSRIMGPWSDRDKYIPRSIRKITKLYPWQETMKKMSQDLDNLRYVDIVVDETGNIGKSTITKFLCVYGYASLIPCINEAKDIMRIVMDKPKCNCYIMDMPRCMKKEKLIGIFSAVETVKNGYCYDDRYNFKEEWFDEPNFFIFTNQYPNKNYLSTDRWRLWNVIDNELVKVNFPEDWEERNERLREKYGE